MRSLALRVVVLATALLSSCTGPGGTEAPPSGTPLNPVTGEALPQIVPEQEEVAAAAERHAALVAALADAKKLDPVQSHTLRTLRVFADLAAVVHRSQLPWQVHLIDLPELSAFTAGGGYVYVYEGVFGADRLVSEGDDDELAAVLAHLMAHAALLHTSLEPDARRDAERARSDPFHGSSFTAEQEEQADRLAALYMAFAGYNPRAAWRVWGRAARSFGSRDLPEFLLQHPLSLERADRVAAAASDTQRYYTAGQQNPDWQKLRDNNPLFPRQTPIVRSPPAPSAPAARQPLPAANTASAPAQPAPAAPAPVPSVRTAQPSPVPAAPAPAEPSVRTAQPAPLPPAAAPAAPGGVPSVRTAQPAPAPAPPSVRAAPPATAPAAAPPRPAPQTRAPLPPPATAPVRTAQPRPAAPPVQTAQPIARPPVRTAQPAPAAPPIQTAQPAPVAAPARAAQPAPGPAVAHAPAANPRTAQPPAAELPRIEAGLPSTASAPAGNVAPPGELYPEIGAGATFAAELHKAPDLDADGLARRDGRSRFASGLKTALDEKDRRENPERPQPPLRAPTPPAPGLAPPLVTFQDVRYEYQGGGQAVLKLRVKNDADRPVASLGFRIAYFGGNEPLIEGTCRGAADLPAGQAGWLLCDRQFTPGATEYEIQITDVQLR